MGDINLSSDRGKHSPETQAGGRAKWQAGEGKQARERIIKVVGPES